MNAGLMVLFVRRPFSAPADLSRRERHILLRGKKSNGLAFIFSSSSSGSFVVYTTNQMTSTSVAMGTATQSLKSEWKFG
jgi:N-acetylglutamate synthase/N-acetylornithine aminotransferase